MMNPSLGSMNDSPSSLSTHPACTIVSGGVKGRGGTSERFNWILHFHVCKRHCLARLQRFQTCQFRNIRLNQICNFKKQLTTLLLPLLPRFQKATYHSEFRPGPIECRTSSLNSSINFLLPRNLKFYTINLPSSRGNLLSDSTSPVIGETTFIHSLDEEVMY